MTGSGVKILHLDSSITGDASISRQVSATVVRSLRNAKTGTTVVYRDLVSQPVGHMTLATFGEREAQGILEEFMAAEVVVIGAGLYNFSIPSQLKAWLDRVLVAGKTFEYSVHGPHGLVQGKRVIVCLSRGGVYSGDSPMAPAEHAEPLLRQCFDLMGITQVEFIIAEGTKLGEEAQSAALASSFRLAAKV